MQGTPMVRTACLENLDDKRERPWAEKVISFLDSEYPGWKNPQKTYMVPCEFSHRKRTPGLGKEAEQKVFDLLQNFGNSRSEPMFVVHSKIFEVIISERNKKSNKIEKRWSMGEHDFVIIHRLHGIMFFQVKAATTRRRRYSEARRQLEVDIKSLEGAFEEDHPDDCEQGRKSVIYKYPGFVVMPNCPRGDPSVPKPANLILKDDCEDENAFSKWWTTKVAEVKSNSHFDQKFFEYLVMRFVGMSHSIPDILSESIDETKKELEMCTKEQLSVVLSSVPEQWIIGPAGSGKTWLLMKKVLMLAKNALSKGKKEKILVACHNEPLAEMFGKVFKDELILSFPESVDLEEVVEVKTFDSLLYDITGHGDFCIGKHVAQALELLEKGTLLTQRYDHIFIDDFEDLWNDKWPTLFKRMHKNNDADEDDDCCEPKHIWFFFDPNQDIDSSEEQSQLPRESRKKTFRLSKVIRNTQMVFEQTKKYFKSNAKPIELGHDVCGSEIKWDDSVIVEYPIGTHQIRPIKKHIEDLRGQKVYDKDICILTETGLVRDEVSSELKKVGIENQTAKQMFQNDDNKVVVESIWRFKGLESKVVVLYCLPFIEGLFPTLRSVRALLYTAFSRCLCYMIVISRAFSCFALKSGEGYLKVLRKSLEYEERLNDSIKTSRNLSSLRKVGNWTVEPVPLSPSLEFCDDEERVVEATEECLPTE